ncbi:MAG: hypothetical protein RL065_1347 [Bacteroidota bacterium]
MDFNKLLKKQIKKYLKDEHQNDDSLNNFLNAINDSYNSYERDKELANHSFAVSEQEYIALNQKLKSENLQKGQSIETLKLTIQQVEGNENVFSNTSKESLPEIIDYLKTQIEKNKVSELIIKESENRMRHALETIGDNVWEFDSRSGKIFFSQCENLLLGYESDDYKNDTKLWWKCVYKEDRPKIKTRNELYRSGIENIHSLEYRLVHRDGTIKWVMDRGGVIEYDENKKPLRIIGTLTDITHLKQVENELSNSANRLSYLISNMQEGILVGDTNGNVVLSNIEFCKLFGIDASPEALVGYSCTKGAQQGKHLFAEPDKFVERMFELVAKREIFLAEELTLADGKIYLRDYIPIFINDEYNGHLWKYTDITEQKRADTVLRLSEEKYRNMIANMNLGLIEVDLNETIQFANQSFCEMSGYQIDELIGNNSNILIHEDSIDTLKNKIEKRHLGDSDAYEMKMKNKHGDIKWWLLSGAPKYNDKGEMIGSIGIHLDITEQKLMEEDLIVARELAEQSAKAKEVFLANMSHEIRTPMNAIMGMSKQLQKTSLNDKQKSLLNIINSASENLLVVINDVLDISKIEAGKLTIETIGFNLKDVVQRAISVMSHKFEEKGLSILFTYDEKIEKVLKGDPYRMNQVLLNLLSNAVKFTEKGGVKINCSLEVQVKNKAQNICIKVIDSGIGMDKQFLNNLFQKFIQEDKSVARKYGGSGLGMTICKQLIELMNGSIEVESIKNEGTTITLNLPFDIGFEKDLLIDNYVETNHDILNGKSILLVEDNEMNRLVACEALSHYQVNITEAENGLEAIEWLNKRPFDLILMDIQMPELDGLEATQIIRKELACNTPIIALTANAIKGESDKCIEMGMNDFISKPFEEEDLVRIMSKWLNVNLIIPQPNFSSNHALYNLNTLQKISKGNENFINKFIHLFITQTPNNINIIRESYQTQNFELLKSVIHKIKPIIENLEISDLHDDIKQIDLFVKNNDDNSDLPLLIEKVCFTLSEVVDQLKNYQH